LDRCYDFDWECSRCEKICNKTEEDLAKRMKPVIRDHYKWIKAGYKYYSTAG